MIRLSLSFTLAAAMMGNAQTAGTPASGAPAAAQRPAQPSAASAPAPAPTGTTPQALPKPATTAPAPDTSSAVPSTQTVITIDGVCNATARRPAAAATKTAPASKTAANGPCKTLVTKTQFENLLNAVNPGNQTVAPAMRRNLAQAYVELLTFTQAAEKAGVDKDPKFAEVMRLVRMRTLEDFYRRNTEEKYRNPPATEIQAYYTQNLAKYEEIKLSRIFIPAKNPSTPAKDDWEKKAAQVANDIHDRAAKGEDFEKLQKEAYTTLGLTITPPSTTSGTRRRGMLTAPEEQELFALKGGEVSKLEQEPAGYIIYKVESKETLPMDRVKDEISRELFRQKMDGQLKSVTAAVHADFNDQYFGPPAAPPRPGMPPGGPVGARPASPGPTNSTPPPASQGQAPPK